VSQRKKDKGSNEITCPSWMLTMGDCMSLLLTFFVLLFTFSTLDEQKLMDVMGIFRGALSSVHITNIQPQVSSSEQSKEPEKLDEEGTLRGAGADETRPVDWEDVSPVLLHSAEIQHQFVLFKERLRALGFRQMVTITMIDEGISVSFPTELMFTGNSEQPGSMVTQLLQEFANIVVSVGNEVRVTVHFADQTSVEAQERQYGLALRRCLIIGQLLQKQYHVPEARLGYAVRVQNPNSAGKIEFILVEKAGIHEISLRDFIRSRSAH